MKFTDYLIVFAFIFIGFGIVLFLNGNVQDRSSISNTEYADTLTIACNDAMKVAHTENMTGTANVWEKEGIRNEALKVFYNTLNMCFNMEYSQLDKDGNPKFANDEVKIFTPVVVLIDNDGYYISYNSSFDNTGKVLINTGGGNPTHIQLANSGQYSDSMTQSPINSWTDVFSNASTQFTVRYYLNDTMEISYMENMENEEGIVTPGINTIRGKRLAPAGFDSANPTVYYTAEGWSELQRYVIEAVLNPDLSNIGVPMTVADTIVPDYTKLKNAVNEDGVSLYDVIFDTGMDVKSQTAASGVIDKTHVSNATYQSAKIGCMVRQINEEVTYYVNYQNIGNSKYNVAYKYVMPEVSNATWHRLLENPTIISFLQGNQQSTGQTFANVFSTSGGEMIRSQKYYISEETIGGKKYKLYHYLEAYNCPYYNVVKKVKSDDDVAYTSTTGADDAGAAEVDDPLDPDDDSDDGYRPIGEVDLPDPDPGRGGTEDGKLSEKFIYNVYEWIPKSGGTAKKFEIYGSMEECVAHGAKPCNCAINHNVIPGRDDYSE